MLTRRHIRVKVMQSIYALIQSDEESLEKQGKFLKYSLENMYVLYLLHLSLFIELFKLAKKHLAHSKTKYLSSEKDDFSGNERFVKNRVLQQIVNNQALKDELSKRKLQNWDLHDEYVNIIYKEMIGHTIYGDYVSESKDTYEEDKEFIITLFTEVIAPNDKIYEYFEDNRLTWVDDIPIVNTFLLKRLKKLSSNSNDSYFLPKLLKDKQDMVFAQELLTKTLLNNAEWESEIEGKTPNWDKDRIAEIDYILLKMAICELLNFSSIPEKVTINEYLEIAKEYSTPKSSIFINGILDKLVKEYKTTGKLQKVGRGLL